MELYAKGFLMQKCVFLTSENVNLVYSIITKGGGGFWKNNDLVHHVYACPRVEKFKINKQTPKDVINFKT